VFQQRHGLVQGKSAILQRGALALGEGLLAAAAVDQADALALAGPAAEIQVAVTAFAGVWAVLVLAAELLNGSLLVHGVLSTPDPLSPC